MSVRSPYWPCFHQRCTHKKLGPASDYPAIAYNSVSISFFLPSLTNSNFFPPSDAFYCLSQVQRFFPFIIVQLENSCKKLSSSASQFLLCSESNTKTDWVTKYLAEEKIRFGQHRSSWCANDGLRVWPPQFQPPPLPSLAPVSALTYSNCWQQHRLRKCGCYALLCSVQLRGSCRGLHDSYWLIFSYSDSEPHIY